MINHDAHSTLRRAYSKHRKYVKKANSRRPGEDPAVVLMNAATKVEMHNGRVFDDLILRSATIDASLRRLNPSGDLAASRRRLKQSATELGRKSLAWKVQAIRSRSGHVVGTMTTEDLVDRLTDSSIKFRQVVQATKNAPTRRKRKLRNMAQRRLIADLAATNQLHLCGRPSSLRDDHVRAASYGFVE